MDNEGTFDARGKQFHTISPNTEASRLVLQSIFLLPYELEITLSNTGQILGRSCILMSQLSVNLPEKAFMKHYYPVHLELARNAISYPGGIIMELLSNRADILADIIAQINATMDKFETPLLPPEFSVNNFLISDWQRTPPLTLELDRTDAVLLIIPIQLGTICSLVSKLAQ